METGSSKFLTLPLCALAATLIAGCGNKNDAISQAEEKDEAKGVTAPSIAGPSL